MSFIVVIIMLLILKISSFWTTCMILMLFLSIIVFVIVAPGPNQFKSAFFCLKIGGPVILWFIAILSINMNISIYIYNTVFSYPPRLDKPQLILSTILIYNFEENTMKLRFSWSYLPVNRELRDGKSSSRNLDRFRKPLWILPVAEHPSWGPKVTKCCCGFWPNVAHRSTIAWCQKMPLGLSGHIIMIIIH